MILNPPCFFFQPTFCPRMPHNETLVPKPLQGISKWFPIGTSEKQAWEPFKVSMALFSFKKESEKKKKRRKTFFEDLRSSKLQFRSRTCTLERTDSLWCFASFFLFRRNNASLTRVFARKGKPWSWSSFVLVGRTIGGTPFTPCRAPSWLLAV